jgi:glutamate synthase (ferredoxin)
MVRYSSADGIPAALVEERDACGVGFIASLNQKSSHYVLRQALNELGCMEHRGATSSDNVSGDGAGVSTDIPWKLFPGVKKDEVKNYDGSIAAAVGMFFLPQDGEQSLAMKMIEDSAAASGLLIMQVRDVPVNEEILGKLARDFVPNVKQFVFQATAGMGTKDDFEGLLYDMRRNIQGKFRELKSVNAYICSMSSKNIVYKGMLRSHDLGKFYLDLKNPDFETRYAVYHRRFSTNTVPKWFLAQPMRILSHNGEINTLLGNINWVKSRQSALTKENKELVRAPLVDLSRSDSANLDSMLDAHIRSGRSCPESVMILVPEAYLSQPNMVNTPEVEAMSIYFESMQEAWDGPALLVFADGDNVGASLDRNGLRPARYMKIVDSNSGDEYVHLMSEVGVTKSLAQFSSASEEDKQYGKPTDGLRIVDSGRLGPGQMVNIELATGKFSMNNDIKTEIAKKYPYKDMIESGLVVMKPQSPHCEVHDFVHKYIESPATKSAALSLSESDTDPVGLEGELNAQDLVQVQTLFGWGTEDVEMQVQAMASTGVEATFCMGDDAPLAALSAMPHVTFDYFKQRFAQVTNPPIDPLRERAVMSLNMFLGPRKDTLTTERQEGIVVKIESPVMVSKEVELLKDVLGVELVTVSTLYPLTSAVSKGGLEAQIRRLCDEVVEVVKNGATVINLSDKGDIHLLRGSSYVPPLMAVGAVHHRLIDEGLRTKASIIITTGSAWNTHHIACLVGYGASAVVPYAAYASVINWHGQTRIQNAMKSGKMPQVSVTQALTNYRNAMDKGLLKILSKMGISLLSSYHGAQIFECLGVNDDVLDLVFKGTPSRVSGMSFNDFGAETADFSRRAFGDGIFEGIVQKVEGSSETEHLEETGRGKKLFNYGFMNYFKSGDYHHNNQPLVKNLHSAIREKKQELYKVYEESIRSRPPTTLRDVLEFETNFREPVPLDEVESAESIMTRFVSGGMSLGALSREAHETLAISMNRIGGKSNSGEGGEDFARTRVIDDADAEGVSASFPHLKGVRNGDFASSKIKQIASGRFGVTPQFLMSGEQLEIKMAQGAKPGEGGQLPGAKIDDYIAGLRKSKVGVTLISPPPHHDIYSIEDLDQLIYDLHHVNPKAFVSVKLVSEVGIGTVASGVAKAGADIIQISGHDGGTGASPATSIKHCGSPWELGVAEAHSSLLNNGLRQRVTLRVDGGLKSGWDVVMAAAMGAEEYGFGTIAMIAEGCIMARVCHTNKCPVGVTTQNEALRKRFPGTPDNVVTFFGYVAEEVRQIMAELGFRSIDELIGKPGLLKSRQDVKLKKVQSIDASYVMDCLMCEPDPGENLCDLEEMENRDWLKKNDVPTSNGRTFDDILLEDPAIIAAVDGHGKVHQSLQITNVDRAAFARLSGQVAKKYGDGNFKGNLNFDLTGAGGQSFCAFLSHGMNVHLSGYANDYVSKGMAGGKVVITPPETDRISKDSGFSMAGNTCLYGATGGSLNVLGRVGERFAVRNSGATGVVEGLGDHGCEYMTAGTVVCLGDTGRNFGAGMTGGLAFVIDDEEWLDGKSPTSDGTDLSKLPFARYVNPELVFIEVMTTDHGAAKAFLEELLHRHIEATGSKRAQRVLDNLDAILSDNANNDAAFPKITMVIPTSEKMNPIVLKQKAYLSGEVQA